MDRLEKLNLSKQNSYILILDTDYKIVDLSQKLAERMNIERKKLIHTPLFDLLDPTSYSLKRQLARAREILNRMQTDIPEHFEWLESHNQQPRRAYDIILSKVKADKQTYYILNLKDILLKKTEQWLVKFMKSSQNQNSYIGLHNLLQQSVQFFAAEAGLIGLLTPEAIEVIYAFDKQKAIAKHVLPREHTPFQHLKKMTYLKEIDKQYPDLEVFQNRQYQHLIIVSIEASFLQTPALLALFYKAKPNKISLDEAFIALFRDYHALELKHFLDSKMMSLYKKIPCINPNPILKAKADGQIIYSNPAAKKILTKENQGALSKKIAPAVQTSINLKHPFQEKLSIDQHDYLFKTVWSAEFQMAFIYITDMTEIEAYGGKRRNMAYYDSLTNLANRQYFEDTLGAFLKNHQREQKTFALLLIDFDNFKRVNDNFGHQVGDQLLKLAAKRLNTSLRKNDFAGRLGGDELVVLLPDSDKAQAVSVANKILKVMEEPFSIDDHQLQNSCSIGISLYPQTAVTAQGLMNFADAAMYRAKSNGKNQLSIYLENETAYDQPPQFNLKDELVQAIRKDELFLIFQPYIDLKSNRISGIEAFMRWQHPIKGELYPAEFIFLAEETSLIHMLGQWAIEKALSDFLGILKKIDDANLTLNISMLQVSDARFMDMLLDKLAQYQINPARITLDICEFSVKIFSSDIIDKLQSIEDHGFKISLDSFGNDPIHLNILAKIPCDYIKLNKQFLEHDHPKNVALLKSIIDLAHNLNIQPFQKFVETEKQHRLLKDLGCDYAQGNYYSPALRFDALIDFIQNHNQRRK